MNQGLYSFNQIIEDVKTETGITNLENEYPSIRQLIIRAEREINPYSANYIRKRMIFHKGNGNFDGINIKKPKDFISVDKLGCCKDKICNFIESPTHVTLCDGKKRDKVSFTYWGIQCDGYGNPVVSNNHAEAVIAFIVWKKYASKIFMNEGNMNTNIYYKREFEDRCMEARGEDFFPSEDNLQNIHNMNSMTTEEMNELFCEDYCSSLKCITKFDDGDLHNNLWWWQVNDLELKQNKSDITDDFLEKVNKITLGQAMQGYTFHYPYIGRIGFCIDLIEPKSIEIFDVLAQNINGTLNYFYDYKKRRIIFISKEYITHSSIYLKFNYNGRL